MVACDLCGSDDGFGYTCKLCSQTHCQSHRLPEAHDCPNLEAALPPGWEAVSRDPDRRSTETREWTTPPYIDERSVEGSTPDAAEPLPSVEVPTYGAAPDEDLDSGPDLAADGSLVGQTDTSMLEDEATGGPSTVSRLLPSRFRQYPEAPLLVVVDLVKLAVVVGIALGIWYTLRLD